MEATQTGATSPTTTECTIEYRVERDEGRLAGRRWTIAQSDCGHRFYASGGSDAQVAQRLRQQAAARGCAPVTLVDNDSWPCCSP